MAEFEIIDIHVHLARTIEEEIDYIIAPGLRKRDRWATPEGVIEYMDRNCISKMALMTLLSRQYRGPLTEKAKLQGLPEKQRRQEGKKISEQIAPIIREFNEWGCEVGRRFSRILPFICIAKELGGAKGMVEEVEQRARQGARGIKLHPGLFNLFPDDEEMFPVYEKCQELGLPVLADSAPYPHSPMLLIHPFWFRVPSVHIEYGEPKNFIRVLEAFPRLTLILAHLGTAWWDERVELAQKYPNVYFDTSQGFSAADQIALCPHRGLAEEDAVRIIRKIGVDRILFGTDSPPVPPQPQWEQILRLPLNDEEKQMILAGNSQRILRL